MNQSFQRSVRAISLVAGVLCCASAWSAGEYGRFEGPPRLQIDENDHRTMVLIEDFIYVDPLDVRWVAPKGSRIDGASIPQWAWSIIGGPYEGPYRRASIVHDVACEEKKRPWEAVHLAFYYAMLAEGAPQNLAKLMYAAVYFRGPRWKVVSGIDPDEVESTVAQAKEELGPAGEFKVSITKKEVEVRTEISSRTIDINAGKRDAGRSVDEDSKEKKDKNAGLPQQQEKKTDGVTMTLSDVVVEVIPKLPGDSSEAELERLRSYIENNNPTLEQIRALKL